MTTPLYKHDCDRCRFLGIDQVRKGEPRCNGVDMYVCLSRGWFIGNPTLVRRFSSEPADYHSTVLDLTDTSEGFQHNARLARKLKREENLKC